VTTASRLRSTKTQQHDEAKPFTADMTRKEERQRWTTIENTSQALPPQSDLWGRCSKTYVEDVGRRSQTFACRESGTFDSSGHKRLHFSGLA
jgi:hypothetical protein